MLYLYIYIYIYIYIYESLRTPQPKAWTAIYEFIYKLFYNIMMWYYWFSFNLLLILFFFSFINNYSLHQSFVKTFYKKIISLTLLVFQWIIFGESPDYIWRILWKGKKGILSCFNWCLGNLVQFTTNYAHT